MKRYLMMTLLLVYTCSSAKAAEENTIKSIKSTSEGVVIELNMFKPLPLLSQRSVLYIGDRQFTYCRHPENGRMDTLIFKLSQKEFANLVSGDPVKLAYGLSSKQAIAEGAALDAVRSATTSHLHDIRLDFGKLDKTMLDN